MSLSTRSQLAGMDPYMAWAITYILDFAERRGAKFTITSVNRTDAQQFKLYIQGKGMAVRPGCSQHQYRLAADVEFERADWQNWYLQSVRNFGLTTVQGDPVHVQGFPGSRFREWAVGRGLCPSSSFRQWERDLFTQTQNDLAWGFANEYFRLLSLPRLGGS